MWLIPKNAKKPMDRRRRNQEMGASYLDPKVFWAEAPIIPILIFAAGIVGFVALAYYIGGKRLLICDLNETLRDDTLV